MCLTETTQNSFNITTLSMEPNLDQSMSNEGQVYPQQTHTVQAQADPQQETASKLLQIEEQLQKKQNKSSLLCHDVESKLEQLLQDIKQDDGANFQSIITLRMKELAYNKILVLTYERSYFRLVLAHFRIAKEYIKFKCYQQAINHINQAIAKNVKAAQNRNQKLFHSYLCTYLAMCYYHLKKIEQAASEITKALNLQNEYEQGQRVSIANYKTLVYNVKIKAELNHADVLDKMAVAVEKAERYYEDKKGQAFGLILYEYGKLHLSLNHKQEAAKLYRRAVETIKMGNTPGQEEEIIKIYQQLAEIYKGVNNEEYISVLKLKYQVFQDTYGNSDKKSIVQQRNLAKALLQLRKIDDSLEQFQDIVDKEKKVYGQNSLEVGKELKTVAGIYIAKHDKKQAQKIYNKALKIFHDLGDQRLAREIRMRLGSLQQNQ